TTDPKGVAFNTFLVSKKSYRNFELRFQVRLKGEQGNSGLQFRSKLVNRDTFDVHGPQIDIGRGVWSYLYEEGPNGRFLAKAPSEVVARTIKPLGFNEFYVRCVGKHLTVKFNGDITLDRDFPDLPDNGVLALQIHRDMPIEATFRKMEIRELPPGEGEPTIKPWPFDASGAKDLQQRWAEKLGVPVEEPNSIGMKMRLIPPGTFPMTPDYNVTISKPFRIGIYEVTVGQFRQFAQETGYQTDAEMSHRGGIMKTRRSDEGDRDPKFTWKHPDISQGDNYPVAQLSWNDAVQFCKWLSDKETRTYRLPTEAEWTWACRAGNAGKYHFGDDDSLLGDYAWYDANSGGRTHPVGQKKANAWGLFDMHGNVCEYCQDWVEPLPNGDFTDPQGPKSGKFRAIRSSGFYDNGSGVNRRGAYGQRQSMNHYGFRVVCEAIPVERLKEMPMLLDK
ncbi:MAG TPA: SUMF1/EgtB/PvdO family nonheme iron enzyme, partial [Gemmataceae bacterium]|nr:SUMF1/EgtB/PvdO family nonheme iron enzyme [Gemmataceae bacterium]